MSALRSWESTMKISGFKAVRIAHRFEYTNFYRKNKRDAGRCPASLLFSRVKIPLDRSDCKAVGSILAIFIENLCERKALTEIHDEN